MQFLGDFAKLRMADRDMADEFPLQRELSSLRARELDGLANVVDKDAADHHVAVEARVDAAHLRGEVRHRKAMVKEPASEIMVVAHRGRPTEVLVHKAIQQGDDEFLHIFVADRFDIGIELRLHRLGVHGGARNEKAPIDGGLVHRFPGIDFHLQMIGIDDDRTFDVGDFSFFEDGLIFWGVVPFPGFDGSRSVLQGQSKISL